MREHTSADVALCEPQWYASSRFPGSLRPVVSQRGERVTVKGQWYSNGNIAEALKSGLAVAFDSSPSLSHTGAAAPPDGMPSAYTVAIVGLCMQPSNQPFNRSAKQQCCLVPVAHCAPAPG